MTGVQTCALPIYIVYIWHSGNKANQVQKSIEQAEFEIKWQIIWAKNHIVIGRGHYHPKHEPCFYAVRKNKSADWIGDRKQTTLWEIDKAMKNETGHSTQKPLECMARPIRNHKGDVYDPFLGSGTTMVACEILKRKCFAIEISPEYVQICIDRIKKLNPSITVQKRNGI